MEQTSHFAGSYQGQGPSGDRLQNYLNPRQATTVNMNLSLNNPATVLSHSDDLDLTSKQVQSLEKMRNSGKQHAAFVLTKAQRKQLAEMIGVVRKPSQ
jgi:hypothetical protein